MHDLKRVFVHGGRDFNACRKKLCSSKLQEQLRWLVGSSGLAVPTGKVRANSFASPELCVIG